MDSEKLLHLKIKAYLKEKIESGELPEGARLPSENELSAYFGVNRNWPRRALRELEVEGYVQRSQGKRSEVASKSSRRHSISVGKVPTLALVLPEYLDLYERTIADGFMMFAANHDVHSMLYIIRLTAEDEEAFLIKIPEIGVAGLAIWVQHETPGIIATLEKLNRKKFPVVLVDRFFTDATTDFIVTDNEVMAHNLTCALLTRGHRRIAFVSLKEEFSSARHRIAGYQRALSENGIAVSGKYLKHVSMGESASIRSAVTELMGQREAPTAIVCIHDFVAGAIMAELDHLDYRVPGHVELAAVDDGHDVKNLKIPMITARQQGHEMGRLAAELLLTRLYDPELPRLQQYLAPFMDEASDYWLPLSRE